MEIGVNPPQNLVERSGRTGGGNWWMSVANSTPQDIESSGVNDTIHDPLFHFVESSNRAAAEFAELRLVADTLELLVFRAARCRTNGCDGSEADMQLSLTGTRRVILQP
jgi:hypothetical protein